MLAAIIRAHPQVAHDDPDLIDAAWGKLTSSQRKEAHDRHADWLADKGRRSALASLPNYFGKHMWQNLPPRTRAERAKSSATIIGRHDRAWYWLFHEFVRRHGIAAGTRDTAAHQELARRLSSAGWLVATPDDAIAAEEGGKRLVQVERDGSVARAWVAYYAGIGPPDQPAYRRGVRMPMPDSAPYVWVPTLDPQDWNPAAMAESEEA
jgi:hypothetical protein